MDRWALSGAGFQAPWQGVLEKVWLNCCSYLPDVKRGHNPSRNHGRFGLHVLLKLFFFWT